MNDVQKGTLILTTMTIELTTKIIVENRDIVSFDLVITQWRFNARCIMIIFLSHVFGQKIEELFLIFVDQGTNLSYFTIFLLLFL